jgi:hypothetical protein
VEIGHTVALKTALANIVEINDDYSSLRVGASSVRNVYVDAKMNGAVSLRFLIPQDQVQDFRGRWGTQFPRLAEVCDLETEGAVLIVKSEVDTSSYDSIASFCYDRLANDMVFGEVPLWHTIDESQVEGRWPRLANYFIALFILGSIARYEPESMLDVVAPDSEMGWFLARFMKVAERYFPQHMLNWIGISPVYF